MKMSMQVCLSDTRPTDRTADDRPHSNRALVLDAMTSLFQRHDVSAVGSLYADDDLSTIRTFRGVAMGCRLSSRLCHLPSITSRA
jgi:hypothetical protein